MVVGLLRVVTAVAGLSLVRHKQQQPAIVTQDAPYLFQDFRRITAVFEHMVADNYIYRRVLDACHLFDKLYTMTLDDGLQML